MEKGDLSQRVKTRAKDEIGKLAHAFNTMADSLARSEQLRRNMVSDVAHELRTPLTNIRGYLEALQDRVVQPTQEIIASLYEESLLLNRLVADLQELSLAVVKQMVQAHGGRVGVESHPGQGACFTFTLPLAITGLDPSEVS